jgi:hypothetical protein
MININQRQRGAFCKEDGCEKTPTFNVEGETKAVYCSEHKKENMVNVAYRHGKCKEDGCTVTYPVFNYPDKKKGEYCKKHMLKGMVDLKNQRNHCIVCKEHQASYNLPSESIAKYCKKCSTEDMVDVKRPIHEYCAKCVEEYGSENRKDWVRVGSNSDTSRFCKKHSVKV